MTSPMRTAVDLAHELDDPDRIHGMLRELQYRGLFDLDALQAANGRRPCALLGEVITDLRDNDLGLAGELVLRSLPADVHRRHARTAEQIARALADRSRHG